MDIAVAGGTGTLGRAVVAELVRRGHDVRVLSRAAPPHPRPGTRHHAVDVVTGAGLDEALRGAEVVVDATNTARGGRKATAIIAAGTRRLLDAEARAGIGHHVAISIVGIDTAPFSYYRAKRAQEELVVRGPVPWSILRATQFHDLLDLLFETTARVGAVPASAIPVAPVDPRLVARVLADAAQAGPGARLTPVAGPQTAPLGELAREWAQARGRRAVALPLPLRRRTRRMLEAGALVPGGDAVTGGPTFGEWLRAPGRDRSAVAA